MTDRYQDMSGAFAAAVATIRARHAGLLTLFEAEMLVEDTFLQINVRFAGAGQDEVQHSVKMGSPAAASLEVRLRYLEAAFEYIERMIDRSQVVPATRPAIRLVSG